MKFLISVIILSLTLTNCGFKPIYSSNNSNFEIIEILNKNENKNSFFIEKTLMSISNQEAIRKVKIEIDFEQKITTILKDSKGDPSKKNLLIKVDLIVRSKENNVLTDKTFIEEFSYDVQSDKFKMSQYEGNITNNLNVKISNDIILLLGTLE
tara:strand:+ start:180 stop:638 length:459 start_codon:yes stop_codon:yes gene_type:complete